MAELGKDKELGEAFKAKGPVPGLGDDKADQETTGDPPDGGAGRLAKLGKGRELGEEFKANGPASDLGEEQADQETTDEPPGGGPRR